MYIKNVPNNREVFQMSKATKPELHMYLSWKAQAQLELKNAVQSCNHKLIEESKATLSRLEENYSDVDLGKFNNKKSFIYHNNGKTYFYPGRFTSDSDADRKCRIKYQSLFVFHYELFKYISESHDEEWLEAMARATSAKEPHFTGFDGDGYKKTTEAK